MTDQQSKIQLVQRYIRDRKGVGITIRIPQSFQENMLLNHAYTIAKGYYLELQRNDTHSNQR